MPPRIHSALTHTFCGESCAYTGCWLQLAVCLLHSPRTLLIEVCPGPAQPLQRQVLALPHVAPHPPRMHVLCTIPVIVFLDLLLQAIPALRSFNSSFRKTLGPSGGRPKRSPTPHLQSSLGTGNLRKLLSFKSLRIFSHGCFLFRGRERFSLNISSEGLPSFRVY